MNAMNTFNNYEIKILGLVRAQYPRASEIMLTDVIEHIGDEGQYKAFIDAMDFLLKEGFLDYQHSMFGKQLYSAVTLTQKGLSIS